MRTRQTALIGFAFPAPRRPTPRPKLAASSATRVFGLFLIYVPRLVRLVPGFRPSPPRPKNSILLSLAPPAPGPPVTSHQSPAASHPWPPPANLSTTRPVLRITGAETIKSPRNPWKTFMAPTAGPIIMKASCSCLRGTNGLEGNAEPSISLTGSAAPDFSWEGGGL